MPYFSLMYNRWCKKIKPLFLTDNIHTQVYSPFHLHLFHTPDKSDFHMSVPFLFPPLIYSCFFIATTVQYFLSLCYLCKTLLIYNKFPILILLTSRGNNHTLKYNSSHLHVFHIQDKLVESFFVPLPFLLGILMLYNSLPVIF